MESDNKLEDLRSTLSCVFEKLGAESLTEPDRIELVTRAETVQEQIDAIQDGLADEEWVDPQTSLVAEPSDNRLF